MGNKTQISKLDQLTQTMKVSYHRYLILLIINVYLLMTK